MTSRRGELLAGAAAGTAAAALAAVEGLGAAGAAGGFLIGLALGPARAHPRAAWVVAAAAGLAIAPLGISWGVTALLAVHLLLAGRSEGRAAACVALVAITAAMELAVALAHDAPVPGLVVFGAAWIAGRALRDRDLAAAELAERGRQLAEEHDAHAALALRYERARIASDLHDVVAHAVSVMVIQAGAGQRVAHDPARAAETFEAIAGAARDAERDMERLVRLLADDRAAAPGVGVVETIIARAASGGLDVTLRSEGERTGLAPDIADAVTHVVQEGLTNVLRYAGDARVTVRVRGEPETVLVEVRNGPARREPALTGAGTGHGIRGLRERAGACGGSVTSGPTPEGGWSLAATLPTRRA